MKRMEAQIIVRALIALALCLLPMGAAKADDDPAVPGEPEQAVSAPAQAAPKSELDNLKAEWEAVREQQIQMIREKEEQLEKLKEDIFAKMKALNAPAAPSPAVSQPIASQVPATVLPVTKNAAAASPVSSSELEAAKEALQAERQKFFREMNRQKESLRQLQSSLDEKAKQLEVERQRFEQAKKTAVS